MKSSPAEIYLTEVLGVKTIVTPSAVNTSVLTNVTDQPESSNALRTESGSDNEKTAALFKNYGDEPQILLWVPHEPGLEETDLLSRMMKAAKISQYLVFWGTSLQQVPPIYFEAGLKHGIKFFGSSDNKEEVTAHLLLIHSSTLASMLTGSSFEIQANKKKVWGHIQDIQQLLPKR